MLFVAGAMLAIIFGIWHNCTDGSVSGFFATVGIAMMVISVLIFAGKHLP